MACVLEPSACELVPKALFVVAPCVSEPVISTRPLISNDPVICADPVKGKGDTLPDI